MTSAGSVIHKTMRPSEKIELVEVKKNAQCLYAEGDSYNFMDTETYEQYAISGDQLGDDVIPDAKYRSYPGIH